MLFSSLEFLYLFLPFTLALYFLSPRGVKNYVLLVASLIFYGIARPEYIPLLLAVCFMDYLFGLAVAGAKSEAGANALTTVAVIFNVGTLFVYKYFDAVLIFFGFEPMGLELPTGISFYIFQAVSYVCDVRRRAARVQRDPLLFTTYVSLFPQLVAGPIVRYTEIEAELTDRKHSVSAVAEGLRLFSVGLAKKMLLANGAGECWERMARYSIHGGTTLGAWLGLVFFAFQIYFDFSGYSDMARGLGRIFGFEFPENFRYPYVSRSITEFWRRWHITLSSWFREYVYIPLGGNRHGKKRMYLALFATWLLTGIWHGAGLNFLLWGMYFFVLLVIEKAFLKKRLDRAPSLIAHAYALFFILIGWLIFECGGTLNYGQGVEYLGQLFGIGCAAVSRDALFELLRNLPYIFIMAIGVTPLPARILGIIKKRNEVVATCVASVLSILSFVLCTCYLADSGYNPFLYFKF